jgi:hypothetical protein
MLKVQSFAFSDSDGINELLLKYRLAQGASIFVSNGEICIPYEDGEPMNDAQKVIAIKEQKNTLLAQGDIVDHSQRVLKFLIKDATVRVDEAQADQDEAIAHLLPVLSEFKLDQAEEKYIQSVAHNHPKLQDALRKRDEANEALKTARGTLTELKNQYKLNEHEILRMKMNIELFDEQIEDIEGIK